MTGPVIEVLASDPDDEPRLSSRRPGVLVAAALVAALVVGAVAGSELTRAVQRHRAAAPPPTRLSAAALPPAGGEVTSSASGAGWVTDVDLAVVNAGPKTIGRVVASWASLDSTPVGTQPSLEALGILVPGAAVTARLRLYRSCVGSQPAPPQLLLTWSRGGSPQSVLVTPVGLDRVWDSLQVRCNASGDSPINALDVTLAAVPKGRTVTLMFQNLGDVPLTISSPKLGPGLTIAGTSRPITVGAHTASSAPLRVTVTSCRKAIEGLPSAGVTFGVSSRGHAAVGPTYSFAELSEALSAIVYAVCGH